jgi:hypothetical protein
MIQPDSGTEAHETSMPSTEAEEEEEGKKKKNSSLHILRWS